MVQELQQRVLAAIDENEMIDLAKSLCEFPSFKTEETEAARFLADYLSQRGYDVQLQEVDPGRFQTIATLNGTGGGKSLMFNGHIDIDPIADGWKRDPWKPVVEGDRLYGGGIRNMKSGDASMIQAAEAIRKAGVRLKGDLVIACVVGELQGGVGTTYLCQHGPLTDMAVVTEPHGAHNIMTIHAGVVAMAVHTKGRSRHTSRKGDHIDAIEKMYKAITAINNIELTYTRRPDLPDLPLVNVGVIIGGMGRGYDLKGPNFSSDFCTVLVDIRTLPGMSSESVVADLRRALDRIKAEDKDFDYEIEMPPPPFFKVNRVVMEPFELPQGEYIIDAVRRQYRTVTGKEPEKIGVVLPNSYTGNDTCHLWKAGVPCVLFGPRGRSESSEIPDEFTPISEMTLVARVLALTALDVCNLPNN